MQQARRNIATDYTHDRNTLIRDVAARVEDRIGLEIGDSKSGEFIPQAKILRWDNETNFSIRRDNGARSFVERDGKVVAEGAHENVVIYELEPDEQNEDGGLEIEIELPRRPKTNVFEFTLQTKGLNFYYQPALTAEEIEQGSSQPENVIGSYAVYHATKRDNRVGGKHYKTGKAFHIYRPKAIDDDGAEVWCELNIDEEAGILTVTVPQDWLNRASYPVRVDPTFGYTSVGGSTFLRGISTQEWIFGNLNQSIPENGTVTEIAQYFGWTSSGPGYNTSTSGYLFGVYDGTAFEFASPETKVSANFSQAWKSIAISSESLLAGSSYALLLYVKAPPVSWGEARVSLAYDSAGSDSYLQYSGSSYPTFSDPLASNQSSGWGNTDYRYSIYATYTAAPSASAPTVTTQAVTSITETTATGNGNVTDDGGATITERGVCWSTSPTPTTADSKATAAGTTGAFTASITGLTASTTYYVRAYAINSEGTSYGAEVTFTTDAALIIPTKIKVGGVFVATAPKVKISGTFLEKTSKVKVGGTFT